MLIQGTTDFDYAISQLVKSKEVSFDFETTDLHHKKMYIEGCAFKSELLEPVYVDYTCFSGIEMHSKMREIFNTDALFIAHNFVFDGKILRYFYDLKPMNIFDTMVASWSLDENTESHGLKNLARTLLGYDMVEYKKASQGTREEFAEYAKRDADSTFYLYKRFSKELEKEPKLNELFYGLEMPFLHVLIDILLKGFNMDEEFLRKMETFFTIRLEEIENDLSVTLGNININSPQQLAEKLYGLKKLKASNAKGDYKYVNTGQGLVKCTRFSDKTAAPSTAEAALQDHKGEHPIIDGLLNFREVTKLLHTYAIGYQQFIIDGKIYPNFNPIGTVTGRLASDHPNLQNLPRAATEGWFIRNAFVAAPGCVLVVADESQLELRILAHFSEDVELTNAYLTNTDIHALTAQNLFGEVTKESRTDAKVVNFAIMYGMGPPSLAEKLKISQKDAKIVLSKYFAMFYGVQDYFKQVEIFAKKHGFVKTVLGRKRRLPGIFSTLPIEYSRARRQAVNSVIQGSAADILKAAMVKITDDFRSKHIDANILSQIHDELVIQCVPEDVDKVLAITKQHMEHPFGRDLKVPLLVEPKVVTDWGKAKD